MTLPAGLQLLDTSALARAADGPVRRQLVGLLAEGVAATCATVDLEVGYSRRGAGELAVLQDRRSREYHVLPVDDSVAQRARQVQSLLARRGLHRAAGIVDLLTATAAERHHAVVVHDDADFEQIAAVTGQAHRWVAPRGSLD